MSFWDVAKTVAAPQYAAVQAARDTLKGKKGVPGAPGKTTIIREKSGAPAPMAPPPPKPWYSGPVPLLIGAAVLLGGFLMLRRRGSAAPALANPWRRRRRRRRR